MSGSAPKFCTKAAGTGEGYDQRMEQNDLLTLRCADTYLEVSAEEETAHEEQLKADSYISLSQSVPEMQNPESSVVQKEIRILKVQLRQAEEMAQKVQHEVSTSLHLYISLSFMG